MTTSRFDRTGRLQFPAAGPSPKAESATAATIVSEVFCPHGHNLVSERFRIDDHPGILLGFRRPNGVAGEVVLSPQLGKLDKIVLAGELVAGEVVTVFCPICRTELDVLCHCEFHRHAPVCLLYQSRHRDLDDAIAFCCVVGCPNSSYRRAGEVIRAIRVPHL